MSLSITEANAVNVVLRYVLGQHNQLGVPVTHEQARDAAALLADKAHKPLMAGLTGDDVRKAWPALIRVGDDGLPEWHDSYVEDMHDQDDAVADHPFVETDRVPGYCKRCGCSRDIHPKERA